MSEPAANSVAASPIDKVKSVARTLPIIAMSAGAGVAGGGLLDEQLSDIITDITTGLGWSWLQHPTSWAGVLIFIGGLIFHIKLQSKAAAQ